MTKNPNDMTIKEMAEAIGWSRRQVADMTVFDERTVRRWDDPNRREQCPDDLRRYLEALAYFHINLPLPASIRARVAAREAVPSREAGG